MKKILRIGGIARVSHDEQKKYGYSINAQIDKIKKWCEDEQHQLVDLYIDEGYSASNMKRPNLQRLLKDLNKLDAVVFTRLDRFSRNVLDANKMLELFQKHNVALISIEEDDIDTTTADGMFMFQLKVSLAERELKKGSERIKSVFEYKIKNGQPITGQFPLGYKIVEENGIKRVDIDEDTRHIIIDMFEYFSKYHSIRQTMEYINNKYSLNRGYATYLHMIKNTLYAGIFKDNEDYCPPYITKKQYYRNQELIETNLRFRKTNNIFLFTSLIRCPICGGAMVGQATTNKKYNKKYYNYRCCKRYVQKICTFDKSFSETLLIEPFLLNNIDRLVEEHIAKVTEVKRIKNDDPRKRIKEIKKEMENLNYMFMKKRIETNKYDELYETLEKELKQLELNTPLEQEISHLQEFLNSGWRNIYESLNRENKRALWRNLIKEIVIDEKKNIKIIFL